MWHILMYQKHVKFDKNTSNFLQAKKQFQLCLALLETPHRGFGDVRETSTIVDHLAVAEMQYKFNIALIFHVATGHNIQVLILHNLEHPFSSCMIQ